MAVAPNPYVRHFLLNPGQIATPIKSPVSLGRIEKAGALWRIVVAGIAVKKAVGDDLIDDLFFEVLRATKGGGEKQDEGNLR